MHRIARPTPTPQVLAAAIVATFALSACSAPRSAGSPRRSA